MDNQKNELDAVLEEINTFGKYQLINFILLCLPVFTSAIYGMAFIFSAGNPTYRCRVEQCDIDNQTSYHNEWIKHAIPFTNNEPSKCYKYDYIVNNNDSTVCDNKNFNRTNIIKCHEFVYENEREVTIANEWNLTCPENEWKLTIVGTIASFGQSFGLVFSGFLSDKFGRKMVLVMSTIASATIGLLKASSKSYGFFIGFEFLENFMNAGLYASAFILGKFHIFISY